MSESIGTARSDAPLESQSQTGLVRIEPSTHGALRRPVVMLADTEGRHKYRTLLPRGTPPISLILRRLIRSLIPLIITYSKNRFSCYRVVLRIPEGQRCQAPSYQVSIFRSPSLFGEEWTPTPFHIFESSSHADLHAHCERWRLRG